MLRKEYTRRTMRKTCLLAFVATLALAQVISEAQTVAPTTPPDELMTVTLYSPAKYKVTNAPGLPSGRVRPDFSRAYFDFTSGKLASSRKWDVSFGTLGDWLLVGFGVDDDKSTIKDLGRIVWKDTFKVPVVPPLPELKPGEARYITTGGKGPARGLPSDVRGAPNARDQFIDVPLNDLPVVRESNAGAGRLSEPSLPQSPPPPQSKPSKAGPANGGASITMGPPNAKRSKPAPVVARVVPDHMYVIHVVKAQSDFYVLVHVDVLVPADNCTISWKRIPAP